MAGGLRGVVTSARLEMKACQGITEIRTELIVVESSRLSEEVRQEMGITKTFPRTIQDAWQYLSEDEELVNELGETFVTSYLAVKQVLMHMVILSNRSASGILSASGTRVKERNG